MREGHMQNLERAFWGTLAVLVLLWLVAEPRPFGPGPFFPLRDVVTWLDHRGATCLRHVGGGSCAFATRWRWAAGQWQDHLSQILSRRQSNRDRNRGAAW